MKDSESCQTAGGTSVATPYRRMLFFLWVIFLFRAGFYLSFTPVWEGFDEHSHFASIQLMSVERRLPVAARDRISREIYSSLKLTPLPWQPRGFGIGLTHDQYWRLDEARRQQLEAGSRALNPSLAREQIGRDQSSPLLLLYEGQHPPLYYALCLIPYRLIDHLNLIDRVFLIRSFSVLLASGLIPLAFFVARRFLSDTHALLVVWIIAFLPGLMFDVARVGNDSLAVLLFSLLLLLTLRGARSRMQALTIGLILGLGLLTKTSFLAAVIPVGIALLLPLVAGRRLWTRFGDCGLGGLGALAVCAWWYLLNHATTGNWTGLYFTAVIHDRSLQKAAFSVDWLNAFKTILGSHLWFGNWSFLQLRSWIYQLSTVAFLVAVVGAAMRLARGFARSEPDRYNFLAALLFYAFFWAGLAYYVVLTYVTTGVSATGGWYLCIPIASEISVLVAGWTFLARAGGTKAAAAAALAVSAIDFYGVFFRLIPYYTGFILHDARGSLSSFKPWTLSPADWAELISRLTVNKPALMQPEYFLGSAILFVLIDLASAALAVWLVCGRTPRLVPETEMDLGVTELQSGSAGESR